MGIKLLVDVEELKQKFRDGENMWNNKANLSQICRTIDSCTIYELDTSGYEESTDSSLSSIVFLKHIDDLGRIAIPKDVRQALGIKDYDSMSIQVDGSKIIISKTRNNQKYIDELTDIIRTWVKKYPDDKVIIRDLEAARDKISEMKE